MTTNKELHGIFKEAKAVLLMIDYREQKLVKDDDLELNLGLSLGERFGVNKSKLVRSSSIVAILPVVKDDEVLGVRKEKKGANGFYSGLIRTMLLPVETEEERRKRKELRSLRRLATTFKETT
ncbi:hypothetical protein L1987_49932 [Smallanthus sonchifolius]|uniref:Uncharacterized protein n=1 Tax=Smallanthus sonchifolius TaxID=185202 RepID=A0ACB9FVE4_9ASTR|nr:hypothetical protein L1987_49932 [Smallanthus sonchifolius]